MDTNTSLDQTGIQARALLNLPVELLNQNLSALRPLLVRIWKALADGQIVNGTSSKTKWAEQSGFTIRYIQYIIRDGNRRRQQQYDPSLHTGQRVRIKGSTFEIAAVGSPSSLGGSGLQSIVLLVKSEEL